MRRFSVDFVATFLLGVAVQQLIPQYLNWMCLAGALFLTWEGIRGMVSSNTDLQGAALRYKKGLGAPMSLVAVSLIGVLFANAYWVVIQRILIKPAPLAESSTSLSESAPPATPKEPVSVAKAIPKQATPTAPQSLTKDQQCAELGPLVTQGNDLLGNLVRQRASEESRNAIIAWRRNVEDLLKKYAPASHALFTTAEPDQMVPTNYPYTYGGFYQRSSGQVTELRRIYRNICVPQVTSSPPQPPMPSSSNTTIVGNNNVVGNNNSVVINPALNQKPDRHIPAERRQDLLITLAKNPSKVSIHSIMGDLEAYRFAAEWYALLKSAGWEMQSTTVGTFTSQLPMVGIKMTIKGPGITGRTIGIPPSSPAGILGIALEDSGLVVGTKIDQEEGLVALLLGSQL